MYEVSIVVLSLAGWVFAASGPAKLRSRPGYHAFRRELGNTKLIPMRLLPTAAASLVGAEAVTAAGLLAAAGLIAAAAPGAIRLAESALAAAAVLTAALATGVAMVICRGTQARCACFGAHSTRPLGWVHLARNMCLLAMIGAGLAAVPLAHGRPPLAGTVLSALAGAVAALLFIRWDDLAELFGPIPSSMTAAPAARQTARRDG
jgi:hypothetical protein